MAEAVAALFTPALGDLLALRLEQVTRHGHTAAADDEQDLFAFTKAAHRLTANLTEAGSLHRLDRTRQSALKLAAFCLALAESCDRRAAALQS